ncbi:hypothetical protein G6F56_005799 [Rhizopus delemar]|nr:hypothetical protein G6F56_005799 [Rhizopus delemar]
MTGLTRLEKTVEKSGVLPPKTKNQITRLQKVRQFCDEMDAIGSLLFISALCMILLPLVLATSTFGGWTSPLTLGCLGSGVVCALVFGMWEYKWAQQPVIPLGRWNNATPLAGVLCCATVSVFHAANWAYHITYLQISRRASIVTANYIDRSYDAIFLVAQVFSGYLMRRFKVYRPIVCFGLVLLIIGIGLMIPARLPSSSTTFVVVTQLIAGFGAGFIYVPILVAVQSSVPASGAFWNKLVKDEFEKHVPGEYDHSAILGNITYINHLPEAQHAGAVIAYGNVQMTLSFVSLGIALLSFFFFLRMRGFTLSE